LSESNLDAKDTIISDATDKENLRADARRWRRILHIARRIKIS